MEGMVELLQVLRWGLGKHHLFSPLHALLQPEPEPPSTARSGGSSRQVVPCPGEPAASSVIFWCWVMAGGGTTSAEAGGGGRGEAFYGALSPFHLNYVLFLLNFASREAFF